MSSTYTSNGGIEKIGVGEQSGTWGETTNLNFDIIDRLISGVGSITLSGTTHTLTTTDGTLSEGMYSVLLLSGTPSGTNTITVAPNDAQKLYFVKNGCGQTVIFTQGSGTSVSILDGEYALIYCDGGGATANVAELQQSILNISTIGTTESSKVVTTNASGNVTFAAATGSTTIGMLNEGFSTVTSSSNATTIDCTTANNFAHTLTEATTFTFSNAPTTGTAYAFTLKLVQDASASAFAVTWPSAVRWSRGVEPTLITTASSVTLFTFYSHDGGVNWYGFVAGRDMF